MIVENNNIGSQSNQKTVEFQLDNSGGHLFSVLSQLYSRPVDSTIRELATNCGDAHIMSNNTDRPFIIRLPNFEKDILTLCFRDFGPGLSHNEVMSIYRIYGKSTKTNSNSVTGCLGLGSKSPYSISSTFYVKSYKNGKCSQYTCSMDNNSIPNITETPIITDTYHENGLEVIIPFYKEVDFHKILPEVLKYFKVKPLVYMQEGDLEQDSAVNIKWHQIKDVKFLTNTIAVSGLINKLSSLITYGKKSNIIPNEVIQLQIYYPLDTNLILDTIKRYNKLYTNEYNEIVEKFKIDNNIEKIIRLLLATGIQLHAEPGKIAFAPSRETIKYTDLTLIYIVKELVKAAKLFKKIYINMLSELDSYEKIFKYIYLESEDYKILADTFDISKLKNIEIFSSIFKREIRPKMILGSITGNELKTPLNEYKLYISEIEKMDLYTFKSKFGNCFLSDTTQRYLNIFDPTIRRADNSYISTAMVVSGASPFLTSLIEETTKKIYIKLIHALYIEVEQLIHYVFNLSDLDFMAYYAQVVDIFKMFDTIHSEYKTATKSEKAILKQEMLDKHKYWTFLDLVINVNKNRSIDTKTKFGRLVTLLNNVNSTLFTWQFFNANRDIRIVGDRMSDIKKARMDTILEMYPKYNFGNTHYKDIIFHAGITYQKMYRQQQSAKNKFWVNVGNLPFNFEDVVENFIDFKVREIDKLPLDGLAGLKKGDSLNIETYIANVAIWIFYKYYRNEVEIQNEYHINNNINKMLVDELISYDILPEYLKSIKPVNKLTVQRNSSSRMNFTSGSVGEITNSSIWYHYELNKENLALIHDEINMYLDKIKNSLKCMVKISRDSHCWLATAENGTNFRNDYLGTAPFILNEYIERLKYFAKTFKPEMKPSITNWNKAVDFLGGLISLDKEICSKELKYPGELRALYDTSENLITNKDSSTTVNDENHVYRLIHLDGKIIVSRYKEKFILLDSTSFRIPSELRDEFQNRLFSENKICLLNSNLKINIGQNPFPELIDLKELQATATDAKMRKAKNNLYENVSFTQIEKVLKTKFPDFVFLKYIDNYPTKLIKNAFNPIPLIIKMVSDESLDDELMNISFCYNNHKFVSLPVSGFFKPTENDSYAKDLKKYLHNEETKEFFRDSQLGTGVTGAFMLAMGKRNHISFQTFEKLITTFGKEDLLKEYHFFRDYTYQRYKSCLLTYAHYEGFSKSDELNLDSLKTRLNNSTIGALNLGEYFSVTSTNLYQVLKFYKYLKSFAENYTKVAKTFNGKLIDIGSVNPNNYEIEFRQLIKNKSNFLYLMDRIDKCCQDLKKRGTINLEDIKHDFNDYIKPRKTCQKDIISFKNQEDFFDELSKIKRAEILNKKINRRTENKKRNIDAKWNGGKL